MTHGGMVEAGVMAVAPTFDWSTAGGALGYGEGIRLWFEDDQCTDAMVLRFHADQEENQMILPVSL